MSPGHFGREVFVQSVEHRIAALAIDITDQFDVLVEKSIPRNFEGNVLAERRGVQVGGLFQLHQFTDHVLGGDNPRQANSGG